MIFFFKNMFTFNMLNAFFRRALNVNILVCILLLSINLHFIPFVNCVMVFFFFFFYKMQSFKWRRRKVANNYVLEL